ncbi:MAG: sulfatase-like hydrolase/transferase [Candidatus Omnitrophota bacterium]
MTTEVRSRKYGVPGLVWFIVIITELLFMSFCPRNAIFNPNATLFEKIFLLGSDFFLLGIAIFVLIAAFRAMGKALRRVRFLKPVFVFAAAYIIVLLYLLSWGLFKFTDKFLDTKVVFFIMNNPSLMMQHALNVEPFQTMAVFAVALIYAVLIFFVVRNTIFTITPKVRPVVVGAARATAIFTTVSFFCGSLFYLFPEGMSDRSRSAADMQSEFIYRKAFDNQTAPILSFLAGLSKAVFDGQHNEQDVRDLSRTGHPIISMNEYLASFDPGKMKKYNVIVILVESLRPDQLKAFGGDRLVMPNVEALAKDSCLFTDAYTESSHSSYADICPFSSHYPLRSDRTYYYPENILYPRILIYDVLKQLGYKTAIFSSQNEHWGNMYNYLNTGNIDKFFHSQNYDGPTYVLEGDIGFFEWFNGKKRSGKIDDRYTVREAVKWMWTVKDEPFFMYLNLQNSHVPYEVPDDFKRPFGKDKIDFQIGFNYYPIGRNEDVKNAYADSLSYIDSQLGLLFKYLKRSGLYDKTIIVLTGDNGEAFYEHGFAAHANKLYNEVMKVPLIVRIPGTTGKINSQLAQHIDITPTIFYILGIPPHPGFQGFSLLDESKERGRAVFLTVQTVLTDQYAVVKDGWKLIFEPAYDEYFLYDLDKDPGENNNLAKINTDKTKELSGILLSWRNAQIAYYNDATIYSKFYPPRFEQ